MTKKTKRMPSPGLQLRRAWAERPLAVPGVFDALVARLAERLGFSAIYLSGAALSTSAGLPDVGLLSVTEFVDRARTITQATSLPLLCDADTGFGEPLNVERTVHLFESAGVAAFVPLRTAACRIIQSRPFVERVLVVGGGKLAELVVGELQARPSLPYTIVGIVEDATDSDLLARYPLLGPPAQPAVQRHRFLNRGQAQDTALFGGLDDVGAHPLAIDPAHLGETGQNRLQG